MNLEPALQRAVREAEEHVAGFGWDGPLRLFALVRTAEVSQREPELADRLSASDAAAAAADANHLLLIEQDDLAELSSGPGVDDDVEGDDALERILARLAWPPEVHGVALTVERLIVPSDVEAEAPTDPAAAVAWLAEHPRRQDVRIAAGVLRDGSRACVIRTRGTLDALEESVLSGPDLVPGLSQALAATLQD